MTTKRWIAIIAAAALLFISIGVNALSFIFTKDVNGFLANITAEGEYSEVVLEEGMGISKDKIAVVTLDGIIQDTGGASSLFSTGYNHHYFMNQLNSIYEDPFVQGVVLKVNTPGGGVVESADIYDKLIAIQEDKDIPIYVSMGGMAASGGYYVSAPAEKIFVNRETITGSIGVIMESINYAKLAENLGIDFNTIKTGPYKDIMSPSREMKEEEHEMLQEMINDSYERFVDIIVAGRKMTEAEVKKVADGRILNGRQAIEAGLADEFGKSQDVIDAMRSDYKLENATIFEYSNENILTVFGSKVQSTFGGSNVETELIGKLLSDYNSPRMMYLYGEK